MPFRIPQNYKTLSVSIYDPEFGGGSLSEYVKWLRRELALAQESLRQHRMQQEADHKEEARKNKSKPTVKLEKPKNEPARKTGS